MQRKSITCRADNWVGDDNWVSHPSGRQPNFAALNRGRHLCSAGRPSGWALAHILVYIYACSDVDLRKRKNISGWAKDDGLIGPEPETAGGCPHSKVTKMTRPVGETHW